jgi:thiol-disulfide isomerase/thioredoxin
MRRLILTRMRAPSQCADVFVRTAPEVRGDYSTKRWARTPPKRPLSGVGAGADSSALFRPGRIASLLFALATILANLAQDEVRAADAPPRPWTEWKARTEGPLPLSGLDSLDGEHTSLAELRSGAMLAHFFATWCKRCRAELSALQQLHARLPDWSVTIIGIDIGEVDRRVQRFFAGQPVSFPILLDRDRSASKAWQVSILPTTFLLDGDLVPRFVVEADADWAQPEIKESLMRLIRQKAAGNAGRAFAPLNFEKEEGNVD